MDEVNTEQKPFTAQIVGIVAIAEDTVEMTLSFDVPFSFQAGQYVWVEVPALAFPDPKGSRRAFSIVSDPVDAEHTIRIAFRRSESGYKKTLSSLPVGAKVTVIGPCGSSYVLPDDSGQATVFIAGGIGITQFLSVISHDLKSGSNRRMILVYLNKNEKRAAYFKELLQAASEHINLDVRFLYGAHPTASLQKFIAEYEGEKAEWYVCGPAAMVNAVGHMLMQARVPDKLVHYEDTYPSHILSAHVSARRMNEFVTSDMFRQVVLQSSNHIIFTDENGKIKFANKAAEEQTGYSFAEMQDQTPRLWGGLMKPEFYKNLWRVIKEEQKPIALRAVNRKKNGSLYSVMLRISPTFSPSKKLMGFVATEDDVTDDLAAEHALEVSELSYRRLFETAQDGILLLDFYTGIITDVNPFLIAILGYSKEEMLNKYLWEIGVFKNIAASKTDFLTLQTKRYIRFEDLPLETKAGKQISVEFVANAYKVDGAQVIQCNVRDITDRVLLMRQMKDINARDEALLDHLPVGVFMTEASSGKILVINPRGIALLGRGIIPDAKVGSFAEVYDFLKTDGSRYPNTELPLERALAEGNEITTNDLIVRKPDGEKINIHAIGVPVKDANGTTIFGIAVFDDITKETEIDRAKTEFISLASHQLRTPLTTINWYSEMLLAGDAGPLNEKQISYFNEVYTASRRMNDIVKSFLYVLRLETGKVKMSPTPTDLPEIVRTELEAFALVIMQKNIQISEHYEASLPPLTVDAELIRIVIQNLISNAVKYTPDKGAVHISISAKQKGDTVLDKKVDQTSLLLTVQDNGIGIPQKDHEKIFSQFFRTENAKKQDPNGSGLGLYLADKMIRLVGGAIWFISEEQSGATFYVLLPLMLSIAAPLAQIPA